MNTGARAVDTPDRHRFSRSRYLWQHAPRGGATASAHDWKSARTSETVSKAALEAVLCDLPELYGTALEALEEASVRDGDFLHLSAATYRLAALVEYGGARRPA